MRMKELILPSIDECLFQLNYHQYALYITQGKLFDSANSLIEYMLAISDKHIETFRDKIPEDQFVKLKNLNRSSVINKLAQEDFIKLLTEPVNKKLQILCNKMAFSIEQKNQLETLLFNYYICLKIEKFLKEQTIAKEIESDYKNAITISKAFDTNMDNFLKTYDHDKIDPQIRTLMNENIANFKAKMRRDIEIEATGIENSELDDPLSFAKDYFEKTFFKTVLKPGRRPTRSLNGLILGLYKICHDPHDSTYLTKVMAILEYLNNANNEKIEGIELTETIVRKRIKDLLKLEKEKDKISEHNTNYLLSKIAKDPEIFPIQ